MTVTNCSVLVLEMAETYYERKFEEVVNVKMKNPQCRIWNKIEIQNKIEMLD